MPKVSAKIEIVFFDLDDTLFDRVYAQKKMASIIFQEFYSL